MMAMIEVGKDQLWLEDIGGDAPPVVLLHPGIHDSSVWGPVLPHLTGFRTIRYDQRAFGQSPPATESYRAMDDLVAVLDHAELDRAHLVGNSMGGEMALALAVEQPQRVASLTLLAPGINGYDWPQDPPELEAEYRALVQADDRGGLVELFGRVWCQAGLDDTLRAQLERSLDADVNDEEFKQPNPEQWSRAADLSVPTSVIVGGLDNADSTQAGVDLAARIPDADLVRIEDADHLIGLRAPEQVAEIIRSTVARSLTN